MWVFTKHGFLSIVEDENNKHHLLVRARIKGDIEKHFSKAMVEETPDNDYLYRASIPRGLVATTLGFHVNDINYTNYKASIDDKSRRSPWYAQIWMKMFDMQEHFTRTRRNKDDQAGKPVGKG